MKKTWKPEDKPQEGKKFCMVPNCFAVPVDFKAGDLLAIDELGVIHNLTAEATPQAPESQDMPRETGETSEGPT